MARTITTVVSSPYLLSKHMYDWLLWLSVYDFSSLEFQE
jgi:hypothetical protein